MPYCTHFYHRSILVSLRRGGKASMAWASRLLSRITGLQNRSGPAFLQSAKDFLIYHFCSRTQRPTKKLLCQPHHYPFKKTMSYYWWSSNLTFCIEHLQQSVISNKYYLMVLLMRHSLKCQWKWVTAPLSLNPNLSGTQSVSIWQVGNETQKTTFLTNMKKVTKPISSELPELVFLELSTTGRKPTTPTNNQNALCHGACFFGPFWNRKKKGSKLVTNNIVCHVMSLSEPLIPFHGVAGCCCWSQSQPCLRARAGYSLDKSPAHH